MYSENAVIHKYIENRVRQIWNEAAPRNEYTYSTYKKYIQ